MYTIRKTLKFEMSHQLFTSYSAACHETLHGHSYILELFLKSESVDDTGMLQDFGEIKDKINDYVNRWDHALVMPIMFSKKYLDTLKKYNKKVIITRYNPTAELMAEHMFFYIKKIIPLLCKVRLHETTTGWAEYEES